MLMKAKVYGFSRAVAALTFLMVSMGALTCFSQPLEDPVRAALRRSMLHFAQVLNVYNRSDMSLLKDFLQQAVNEANNARESKLAGLLSRLRDNYAASGRLSAGIAGQVAKIYNGYIAQYAWAYPFFDTKDPTVVAPGSQPY